MRLNVGNERIEPLIIIEKLKDNKLPFHIRCSHFYKAIIQDYSIKPIIIDIKRYYCHIDVSDFNTNGKKMREMEQH